MSAIFTVKIYRGGIKNPSSVDFHPCQTPRVIYLNNPLNDAEIKTHEASIKLGATHAIETTVETSLNHVTDNLYLFSKDVMFIENCKGETVFSINRKA